MTGKLTSLLLLTPALLLAQETSPTVGPPKRKLSVGEVLEPNSVLTGVMLPSYDRQLRLTSVLRAKSVTLVSKEELDGEAVQVKLYQPDRSIRGTIALARARLNQETGKVLASGETRLVFDRATTTASGLVFRMNDSLGVLTGPVVTRIAPRPKTAMNQRVSPFRAVAVLGTALAIQPLGAAPAPVEPPPTAPAPAPGTDPAVRAALKAALDASAAATAAAAAFMEQEQLLAQNGPAANVQIHQPKPLDIKPGPDDTVISCDGASFIDGVKGILSYQGNVTVRDPGGSMDGANDLQAFFAKVPPKPGDNKAVKPEEPKDAAGAEKDKNPLAGVLQDADWELDKVVATGAVHITLKTEPGKEPIEAGGAIFTYLAKSDTITITGGQPWIRQGNSVKRTKLASQTITIRNKETFSISPGGVDTFFVRSELEKEFGKDKDKSKDKSKDKPKP